MTDHAPPTPSVAIPIDAKPAPELVAARRAVTAIFFVNGVVTGTWFPRIPAVADDLGLSEGTIGVTLLGTAVGSLVALSLVGGPVARYGSRPVTTVGILALAASLTLPGLARNAFVLFAVLAVYGAALGGLDVAMNTHGVAVERRYGRPILSSYHAAFSFGGLAGAIFSGLMAWLGVAPLPHFLLVAALAFGAGWAATRRLLPASVDAVGPRPRGSPPGEPHAAGSALRHPSRRLVLMGLLALSVLLGEGAMADWSALYLDESLGTGPGLAAFGFAAFSLTMAGGRLVGDRLTAAWGGVALARRGGFLVAGGMGAALALNHPAAAIAGCLAVGAGLSCVFPVVLSAAGQTPGIAAGPAIALVSALGYGGFLVGPPLIGLVAEVVSLPVALGIVVVMGAIMVGLAGSLAPARSAVPVTTARPVQQ